MNVNAVRRARITLFSSRHTWIVLGLVYLAMIAIVLGPVLLSSVGGDDRYWILRAAPASDGSFVKAFWYPLSTAFEFDPHPRTTALAFAEREVLALLTMNISTFFAVPPLFVWAMVKVTLVALLLVATRVFLHQVRFRGADGTTRGLERSSIAFICIMLPLTIAIGAKSQDINTVNGWNYYPTLTYGTFVGYLLFCALVLKVSRVLDHSYRARVVPVVVLMAVSGVLINLSYELLALLLPLTVLVLATQPLNRDAPSRWQQWRGRVTVLLALAIPYSALFLWIRWRISQMACQATDSCYRGTVIDVRPGTLVNNFLGAFPGNTAGLVTQQTEAAGRAFPSPTAFSIIVGVLAAAAAWGLVAHQRSRRPADTSATAANAAPGRDTRGLVVVLMVCLSIAAGSAIITGITERATSDITTPALAYRSGVTTWSALAVAGLVVVLLLTRTKFRLVGVGACVALTVALVASVAVNLPRNVVSAQLNRQVPTTQIADTIHREVALGDTSAAGDARRCAALATELKRFTPVTGSGSASMIRNAYTSFEYYHHATYCSKRFGADL